jgi:hypothetical protein
MPPPMLTSVPQLSSEGTELPDWYHPVPSPRMGQHRLLLALPGV